MTTTAIGMDHSQTAAVLKGVASRGEQELQFPGVGGWEKRKETRAVPSRTSGVLTP